MDKVQLKGSTTRMTVVGRSFELHQYGWLRCGWLCRRTEKWTTQSFQESLLEVVEEAEPAGPPYPPVVVGDVVTLMGTSDIKMVVGEVLETEAVCFWHDAGGIFHSHAFEFEVLAFV